MPEYRRYRVEGGTYFFTVVTYGRKRFLCEPAAREFLRGAITATRTERPFSIDGFVLLPDHLHAIWTLPRGDHGYSSRWSQIKSQFTRDWLASGGGETTVSRSKQNERRRGVWQPRFIEHTIRDVDDFQSHLDYIHYNPVKHGWAASPKDWPWSSFHRYVGQGVYEPDWGRSQIELPGVDEALLE